MIAKHTHTHAHRFWTQSTEHFRAGTWLYSQPFSSLQSCFWIMCRKPPSVDNLNLNSSSAGPWGGVRSVSRLLPKDSFQGSQRPPWHQKYTVVMGWVFGWAVTPAEERADWGTAVFLLPSRLIHGCRLVLCSAVCESNHNQKQWL